MKGKEKTLTLTRMSNERMLVQGEQKEEVEERMYVDSPSMMMETSTVMYFSYYC